MPSSRRTFTGEFIHRVDIYQLSSAGFDGDGEAAESSESAASFELFLSNVPCRVDAVAGREERNAERIAEMVSYTVKMRWHDGLKPSMQVRKGAQVFRIEAIINPDAKNLELHLLCREVANVG